MRKLIFLFLVLFHTIGFAQKNSIGIFISPNTSFRETIGTDDYKKLATKASFFDFGINYKRIIAKNISFITGLNISNKGFDMRPILVINGSIYSTHFRLTYLELPLGCSYSVLNKKRFRINLGANFINQILLQASFKPYDFRPLPAYASTAGNTAIYTSGNTQTKEETIKYSDLDDAGYRIYNYAISGTAEIQLKLIHNIWLSLLPTYKYALKAYSNNGNYYSTLHQHLYSWGAEVRVSYEF